MLCVSGEEATCSVLMLPEPVFNVVLLLRGYVPEILPDWVWATMMMVRLLLLGRKGSSLKATLMLPDVVMIFNLAGSELHALQEEAAGWTSTVMLIEPETVSMLKRS